MIRILIVEDEDRIRKVYSRALSDEGYSVRGSPNITDANDILKDENFDLMLLDINMGEFGGDILYEIINMFHKDMKVIVSSVYPVEEQKEIIPNAYDYYDKSSGTKELLSKIKFALSEFNDKKEE